MTIHELRKDVERALHIGHDKQEPDCSHAITLIVDYLGRADRIVIADRGQLMEWARLLRECPVDTAARPSDFNIEYVRVAIERILQSSY